MNFSQIEYHPNKTGSVMKPGSFFAKENAPLSVNKGAFFMARSTGFEPATNGIGIRYAIQLRYERKLS